MSSLGLLPNDLLRHYMGRNNTTIDGLDPESQSKVNNFITDVYNNTGIFLLAYRGYSTYEEQQALYNAYLNGGDLAAPPGESWHEYARAIDVMPINSDGSNGFNNMTFQLWQIVHGFAEQNGLCHGFSIGDNGHIFRGDANCNQNPTAWRIANNIPVSSSSEWINNYAPKLQTTSKAGFTSIFLISALIGLFISEDLRKK